MSTRLLASITDFIEKIDPFDKLSRRQLIEIASFVKIIPLKEGQSITLSTKNTVKHLYVIRFGSIEQRKPDGSLRARLGSEDVFGFTFLASDLEEQDPYIVSAIEPCELYEIPHSALMTQINHNPEYTHSFAPKAQIRLKSAIDPTWADNDKNHFVKKIQDILSDNLVTADLDMSIQAVAKKIQQAPPASAAIIFDNDKLIGITTTSDMANRVIATGLTISAPISTVMTPSPLTVNTDDLVLHAVSIMRQHNIGHLPVLKESKLVGLLTTTDLIQNNRAKCIALLEEIKRINNVQALIKLTDKRHIIFKELIAEKMRSEAVGHVMTMIMDATTIRLIELTIDTLGEPPCEFSWIVAGSHARNEIHMLSDQDTALVLDDSATETDRFYFKYLAMQVSNGLDACGYPLCTGKFMAATPKWCQPLSIWKNYYTAWVSSPEYENLLNITVFLEIRSLYGNRNLTERLQESLRQNIRDNKEFLGVLTQQATKITPPLGIFNNLVLEKNGDNMKTLNIKKYAISLIIDLARIYGLAAECHASGTEERFKSARDKQILSNESYMDIIGAYQFIMQFRFSHQSQLMKSGESPNNHINPDLFGNFERKHLKDAFRIISDLQDATKIKFKLL